MIRDLSGGDEEDGVQEQAVAREMLRLLHLQEPNRDKELHSKGDKRVTSQFGNNFLVKGLKGIEYPGSS